MVSQSSLFIKNGRLNPFDVPNPLYSFAQSNHFFLSKSPPAPPQKHTPNVGAPCLGSTNRGEIHIDSDSVNFSNHPGGYIMSSFVTIIQGVSVNLTPAFTALHCPWPSISTVVTCPPCLSISSGNVKPPFRATPIGHSQVSTKEVKLSFRAYLSSGFLPQTGIIIDKSDC